MTLTITPEVAQEFIPCSEARELIQSAWDVLRWPGIYGAGVYIGSSWYVDVPEYIDYLVKIDKKNTAIGLLKMLLDETLDPNGDLKYHAWQLIYKHRLGRWHRVTLGEIERMLQERGYYEVA